MTTLTKESLASLLNGREYGEEITDAEEKQAKENGLVVVFGYSDDNAEFRGAINDEVGSYNETEIFFGKTGLLKIHQESCDCAFCGYEEAKKKSAKIVANFGAKGWEFTAAFPVARFEIKEDGERYGEGIVFSLAEAISS